MAHHTGAITRNPSAENLSMISTIQSKPLYYSEEFLRQKYLVEGLSTRQIALEIRSARSTIKEAVIKFDIPLRPIETARKLNTGQPAFGQRVCGGRLVPHRAELKIIQRMLELRARGKSLDKVAAWLNKKGVPTKSRRATLWSRPTVLKIIRRAMASDA